MKNIAFLILTLLLLSANSVKPPSPVCRTTPLPSVIPISIGETVKFDLEDIFSGYNLVFNGVQNDHISITPKYYMNQSKFDKQMPFRSVKINHNGRFLGLIAHDEFTELAIGINHPESGVQIETTIPIEDQHNLHCFDVEQVNAHASNQTYAMIDCAEIRQGVVHHNQFLFVDIASKKLFLGHKQSDTYVDYNHIEARKVHLMIDPFTRVEYLFRVILSGDVDSQHSDQTYVEIFLLGDHPIQAQIIDVIDHTFFKLPSLAILDYQIHFNSLYLLVKDQGIFRIAFTPNQRIQFQALLQVSMDVQQFRVEQLGFNDDLHVVVANHNTIYQYEWDTVYPAVLVNKYSLISGTVVKQLLVDANFVIVQGQAIIDDEYDRKVWIFSRKTPAYTNAFSVYDTPKNQTSLIIYEGDGRTLHLIHQDKSFNIKLNLPDMKIYPVTERASETEDYVITAKSSNGEHQIECKQTVKFIYIDNKNTSIVRTDLQGKTNRVVDSPDQLEIMLDYQFFGPFINYNVSLSVQNSSILPKYFINKQHKANVNFPFEIKQQEITYLQMFPVKAFSDLEAKKLHGIVQYKESDGVYPIAYIECDINVDDYDEQHNFRCYTLQTIKPLLGHILLVSQVPSLQERFIAMVFSDDDRIFHIYYYSSKQLTPYCQKGYNGTFINNLSDVEITDNKLVLATFELGKRIQVFSLSKLKQNYDEEIQSKPLFTIDSKVMSFFRISYFAPVDIKLSPYHKQIAFVKTKNGIIAMNINNFGMPQFIFQIKTDTALFDFQITRDSLLIITSYNFEMYRLVTPLRRNQQPYFLLQKYDGNFTLEEYGQMDADGFYYLVENEKKNVLVLHPNMPSTSIFYTELPFAHVSNLDATRVGKFEYLFVKTNESVQAWVLAQNPTIRTYWYPSQNNFTMNISAHNQKVQSDAYTFNFNVLKSDEAEIKTTKNFNIDEIRKLGHVKVDKNSPRLDKNVTLNDTDWFTGTITHFNISCKHCNQNVSSDDFQVKIQNHLSQTGVHIHAGQSVYDMKPTFNGVYGQQYNGFFKTFPHNNSIQYTAKIPTSSMGQVCTKMIVPNHHQFVISFCETGQQVNAYITSLTAFKPFTIGPIRTEAQAVNKVKMVGDIVIIVDNDDNPYTRSGGVYLYLFNYLAREADDMLKMLDYLDYDDLQMQGFNGYPYIASADIVKPLYNKQEYSVFISESRTGSVFVFTFEVSDNRQQAVYLARKMLELNKLIPQSAKHPQPLRIQSLQIVDYTIRSQSKRVQIDYVLLITVKNWHHIQIQITLDQEADILFFSLTRLFERVPYPFQLTNYIAMRNGVLNGSYFAVPYLQIQNDWQIVAVYELPRYNLNKSKQIQANSSIPITKLLGAYLVRDSNEITFSFRMMEQHRMLLNDVGDQHLKDLQLNKQLKVKVMNLDPTKQQPQNITIMAINHYTSYNFSIQLTWEDENQETKRQILWIIITVIGVVMIIGLICIWCRQSSKQKRNQFKGTTKQSLLTVQTEFKAHFINRSSVDPESQRGTVDYTHKQTAYQVKQPKKMIVEQAEIDQNDPLEERIAQKEQNSGEQNQQQHEEEHEQQENNAQQLIEKPSAEA